MGWGDGEAPEDSEGEVGAIIWHKYVAFQRAGGGTRGGGRLVFGNEHRGISDEMDLIAHGSFTIPMHGLFDKKKFDHVLTACPLTTALCQWQVCPSRSTWGTLWQSASTGIPSRHPARVRFPIPFSPLHQYPSLPWSGLHVTFEPATTRWPANGLRPVGLPTGRGQTPADVRGVEGGLLSGRISSSDVRGVEGGTPSGRLLCHTAVRGVQGRGNM